MGLLYQCRAKLGRTPLVIFDQFDDYQTRHRSRFLPPRRRTWLSTDRLIEANSFWSDVRKLIDKKVVHCLFATRSDTADGLESIRFVNPQVYPLDRLNADFVLPLLTELTAHTEGTAPVVFAPDRGWEQLKERLARDLREDGAVLPVQMKIALQSLGSLRSLTVRDYERAGRLHGLEATYVEWRIVNTARHSGLTKIQVQTLLTCLADAETLKTVPRSTDDVAAAITTGDESHAGRIRKAVKEALDDLEKKEVIRKRLDPDTHQQVWILDHDYLCRGVLEAERRANPWFVSAQEGYRDFRNAGSNARWKWRSLLRLRQQMVLLTQRVRGRFRYGPLRAYAMWSLLRLVPYFLISAAVVYGWTEFRHQQQAAEEHRKAARLRAAIGLYEQLSPPELDALWELARSNDAVRRSFLLQALEHPATAEQFHRRADMAIRAAVGLDPDRRENVFLNVVSPCVRRRPPDLSIKLACVKISMALSMAGGDPDFSGFAAETLLEAIEQTSDPEKLWGLAQALSAVPRQLSAVDAQKAVAQAIAVIAQTIAVIERTADARGDLLGEARIDNDKHLKALAQALKAVVEKLVLADAHKVFVQLIASMERPNHARQLNILAEALQAVPGELAPADAQRAFTQLITIIERTTNPYQLEALAKALKALSGELSAADVQRAFAHILATVYKTTDPHQLEALAKALRAVPGELAPLHAQRVFAQLLDAFDKTTGPYQLEALAKALRAVPGELAPSHAQRVFAKLLAAVEEATDDWNLGNLTRALRAVPGELAPAHAQRVFAQLLAAVDKTTDPNELAMLAYTLGVVPGKLTPADAQPVFAKLLAAVEKIINSPEKTINPDELWFLVGSLNAVPGELAPTDAQRVFAQILAAVDKTTDPRQLDALGRALIVVPSPIDSQQLINLLKRPVSVGVLRDALLYMLGEQTGQKFDRNIWKMVEWAQQNGLDVKSPPKRPDK